MVSQNSGANLNNARMTVLLGEYFSTLAIWSHSRGTRKFPVVMTIEGRYSKISPRIPSLSLFSYLEDRNTELNFMNKTSPTMTFYSTLPGWSWWPDQCRWMQNKLTPVTGFPLKHEENIKWFFHITSEQQPFSLFSAPPGPPGREGLDYIDIHTHTHEVRLKTVSKGVCLHTLHHSRPHFHHHFQPTCTFFSLTLFHVMFPCVSLSDL